MTDATDGTVSDIVAGQLRRARARARLTIKALAERCAEAGAPQLTAAALMNLESGRKDQAGRRRRAITVDELIILAYVLAVSPVALLLPEDDGPYPITSTEAARARHVYEWLIGTRLPPLPELGATGEQTDEERDRAVDELIRMVLYVAEAPKRWYLTPEELDRLQEFGKVLEAFQRDNPAEAKRLRQAARERRRAEHGESEDQAD